MSKEYDEYLNQHRGNVAKGFYWIKENLPELLAGLPKSVYENQICNNHDTSKNDVKEYDAYDNYFFGEKSDTIENEFNYAWLHHIHNNPHHWQHWILVNDDEGDVILDMPYRYIIEMICDWWAFSWNKENLNEIFTWYNEHKDHIKLSDKTRNIVEDILNKLYAKINN